MTMINKHTLRRLAQTLFPELWKRHRVEAIAKTLDYLYQATGPIDSQPIPEPSRNPKGQFKRKRRRRHNPKPDFGNPEFAETNALVGSLAAYMDKHRVRLRTVAKSLGVTEYTVRCWLECRYHPTADNAAKITKFLRAMEGVDEPQATPDA